MGLFDSLMFDPSTYAPSGGGLLTPDVLTSYAQRSLPSNYGNYGGVPYPIFGQPQDQQEIPPQAQPAQYQPQQAQDQAPQQPQQPSFGLGDRLSAGLTGFANSSAPLPALSNLISGLATGQRSDPTGIALNNQQNTARALYEGLKSSGTYTPQQAAAIAIAASTNPALAQSILPQALGPKQAPTTVKYMDPSGIERTAYYDAPTKQYKDIVTDKPVASQQQPQTPSSSPYTTSAPPPGVDPAKWRQDEAARIADAQKELRTKIEGSVDFLPDALRTMDKIKSGKYDNVIGPINGNPTYNEYGRGYLGGLDPTGSARENLGNYNELNADMKRLSTKNLKATFGGRVTNVEVGLNSQSFGGAQSSDPKTAYNILGERARAAFENIQRGVDAKVIDPRSLPSDVVQKGVEMGFLNPQSFGLPPTQARPAQQTGGNVTKSGIKWSVQ